MFAELKNKDKAEVCRQYDILLTVSIFEDVKKKKSVLQSYGFESYNLEGCKQKLKILYA